MTGALQSKRSFLLPRASGKLLSVSLGMLKMLRNPLLAQELTLLHFYQATHLDLTRITHSPAGTDLICSYQVGFVPTTYSTLP